jgi:hypothetical protein
MTFAFLAATSFTGALIFMGLATIVSASASIYLSRYRPFDRIAQFRVPNAGDNPFEPILHASIGDSPTRHQWFCGTLSFAMDPDWVYLRHSRFLRPPTIWRLPRDKVRLHEHKDWDIRINAADPPLNAFFGSDFVAALRGRNRKK